MIETLAPLHQLLAFCIWLWLFVKVHLTLRLVITCSPQTSRAVSRRLSTLGIICIIVAVLSLLAAGLSISLQLSVINAWGNFRNSDGANILVSASIGSTFFVVGCLILAGIAGIVGASRVRTEASKDQPDFGPLAAAAEAYQWWVWMSIIGWTIPLIFPLPGLILLSVPIAILGLPLILFFSSKQHFTQLLLVISMSVRFKRGLPNEIRILASGYHGMRRWRMLHLVELLENGQSIGRALQQVPGLMPRWVVSQIITAEASGHLGVTLDELTQKQMDSLTANQTYIGIGGLMAYLGGFLVATVMIVGFLFVWIVPKFKVIFQDSGEPLSGTLQTSIHVTNFLAQYWFLFAPLQLLLLPFFIEVLRAEATRWQGLEHRFLHRLWLKLDTPNILRHLAHSINNQVPLTSSLESIAAFHFRPSISDALDNISMSVADGSNGFEELARHGFLSRNDFQFIQSAQRSGNLVWALQEIANLSEKRTRHFFKVLFEFVRPIPPLIMGLITLWIALSFFMPIVDLIESYSVGQ